MREPIARALAIATLAGLIACSNPSPPVGRWEGVYEDQALTVVVRLEIDAQGEVRVSAPNVITSDESLTASDKAQLKAHLLDGLAKTWSTVSTLPLVFDGKAFHKPGGVAPQLEWDAKFKHMTMIYYSGRTASVRVPLSSVEEFSAPS